MGVRRLAAAVRAVGEVDLLVAADIEHGDRLHQPCPDGRLVIGIEFAEPGGGNRVHRGLQLAFSLGLRAGLRARLRLLAQCAQLALHGDLRGGVAAPGLLEALRLLVGLGGRLGRLAELAGAVAVVIAQLLELALESGDGLAGIAGLHLGAHQALPADAVAADGRVVQTVAVARDDGGRRAEDVVVALDGVDDVGAVGVLRHELDDADVVEAVVLVPLDVDEVAALGDIGRILDIGAVVIVELPARVFERAAGGDVAALGLEPGRSLLAAGLQGIVAAEHRGAVIGIGLAYAPGDELGAPLAIGIAAPLAVLAVAALGGGIAQLVHGDGEHHFRLFIGESGRAAQQQDQGQDEGKDGLHAFPPALKLSFIL